MSGLLPLSFAAPWILLALLGLPAIWWLLRVTPPAPQRLQFPAIRLILGMETPEESPAHTPWWMLALRLLIAALVIIALAGPFWNAVQRIEGTGPLVLVIDNTWPAAETWDMRAQTIRELIDDADGAGRPIVLMPTAPALSRPALSLLRPADAREQAATLAPRPFLADHAGALDQMDELELLLADSRPEIVWLSDGMETDARAEFARRLEALGTLSVMRDVERMPQIALTPPTAERNGFLITLTRTGGANASVAQPGHLRAVGKAGRTLARVPFSFESGDTETQALVELPLELRNETTRIEVEGSRSAGGTVLIDEGARRRAVGIVSGESAYDDQPLLSDDFYLQRALEPFADVRSGPVAELIASGVTALVLTDVGRLSGDEYNAVRAWLEEGGLLIRFAGPRLAAQTDDLLPVALRIGDRALGGSLTWDVPQGLLPFDEASPFAGLDISEEVRVSHQVLAEPELTLAEKTWARLSDGTPLVTGARRAEGWSVLFHVTANQDWSTLPASGLYVDMLRRLLRLSPALADPAAAGEGRSLLAPLATMDGYGQLQPPPATAEPISAAGLAAATPTPRQPPGLYGTEDAAHALNPVSASTTIAAATDWPPAASLLAYRTSGGANLMPALLTAAVLLFLLDLLLSLAFAGHLPLRRFARGAAVPALAILVGAMAMPSGARAQDGGLSDADRWAIEAANELHLAYVITGDAESDDLSRAGLEGLTRTLFARTTVEPAEPMGVDLETHELSFFPLLYWRVSPNQASLPPEALERLANYMRNGGTVLIDTADSGSAAPFGGPRSGTGALRRLIADLDVPPLAPVPEDHVLTRAFYLISDFPGRYAGGDLWVEAPRDDSATADRDGVSPILIGSNDYAAAWATDETGRPLATVTPGGARQREIANRFGVNLVMYALTGNYKADQVHIPALLERLGQ